MSSALQAGLVARGAAASFSIRKKEKRLLVPWPAGKGRRGRRRPAPAYARQGRSKRWAHLAARRLDVAPLPAHQ